MCVCVLGKPRSEVAYRVCVLGRVFSPRFPYCLLWFTEMHFLFVSLLSSLSVLRGTGGPEPLVEPVDARASAVCPTVTPPLGRSESLCVFLSSSADQLVVCIFASARSACRRAAHPVVPERTVLVRALPRPRSAGSPFSERTRPTSGSHGSGGSSPTSHAALRLGWRR